jgi:hypothetical protein
MAFTGQSVVDEARRRLKDDVTPNRYTDLFMVDAVNGAGSDLVGHHPQALHDSTMSLTTEFTPITALADSIAINNDYRKQLVNLIIAQCQELDGEHAGNLQNAAYHRGMA